MEIGAKRVGFMVQGSRKDHNICQIVGGEVGEKAAKKGGKPQLIIRCKSNPPKKFKEKGFTTPKERSKWWRGEYTIPHL